MNPCDGAAFYLESLRRRHFQPGTLCARAKYLRWFCEWLPAENLDDLRDVTLQNLLNYHSYVQKKTRPDGEPSSQAYHNYQMWTIAAMFRLLHRNRKILVDPSRNLPVFRNPRTLPSDVLSAAQVNRLLGVINLTKPWGFRDRAMLELLYSSGLRGAELCALKIHDVDWKERTIRVVQGKGRKDRLVPAGAVALAYLREYFDRVRPVLLDQFKYLPGLIPREPISNRLFFNRMRWPLTTTDLLRVVQNAAKVAGIKVATTHALRHSCATEMLKGGASVRHVQEMLGHANMSTTQIYTHVLPYDLKKVHAKTAPSERRRVIQVPSADQLAWRDEH